MPLIEIAVFIEVGSLIGAVPTILLTILTAVAGTFMLRQQGLSLLMRMQKELDAGQVPGTDIMHGAMIVLASILLLIPGFVTDILGLLLFVPPIRDAIARFIIARSNVVVVGGGAPRRREDGVIDLDEEDWTRRDETSGPQSSGQPRISPRNENDDKRNGA
nr:FxsA family protein [Roseibium litorale]